MQKRKKKETNADEKTKRGTAKRRRMSSEGEREVGKRRRRHKDNTPLLSTRISN